MGQSHSRQRTQTTRRPQSVLSPIRPHSSPLQEVEAPSTDVPNTPSSSGDAPAAKRSQRSSLRRSVLSLLPHASSSSSARSRTASNSSQPEPSQSLRKRWRLSRRSSKAQSPSNGSHLPSPSTGACGVVGGGNASDNSSNAPTTQNAEIPTVENVPTSSTSRAVTPQQDAQRSASEWPTEEPPLSQSAELPADRAILSPNDRVQPQPDSSRPAHPTPEDIEREVSEFLNGHPDITRHGSDVGSQPAATGTAPELVLPPSDPASAQTTAQRHFPPPGTLVVVQGVVNTTDTPHNSSSQAPGPPANSPSPSSQPTSVSTNTPPLVRRRSVSTPYSYRPGEDRQSARNRLSTFMRPTSMLGGRPSSSGPQISPSTSSSSDTASTPEIPSRSETVPSQMSNSTPNSEGQDAAANQQRGLSPGSIDVLGTLLSVAAAATAASLFSPGLPFNGNGGAGTSGTGPLSPPPGTGLGGLSGLGGLTGLGLNSAPTNGPSAEAPQSDRDGRDRIRNVWDTIRERVGLNNRSSNASLTEPTDEGSPPDRSARMRPGELMLAEMARALNAGLGLTSSDDTRPPDSTGSPDILPNGRPSSGGYDASLPPENSFERFLINLQADLRTVLSDGSTPSHMLPASERPISNTASTASSSVTPARDTTTQPVVETNDDEDPPPLADLSDDSDADFEYDEDELVRSSPDPRSLPRTPTPIPPAGGIPYAQQRNSPENQSAGADRRQPTVNLWRLYRFQPISTPRNSEQVSRGAQTHASGDTSGSGTPDPSSSTSGPDARSSEHVDNTGNDTSINTIVPVIVVGLQSVDVTRDESEDENGQHEGHGGYAEDVQAPAPGTTAQYGTTPRGRTWHSRAASALRTLRPGRRGSSRGRRASDGSGSRTFLIYVIGGYYPPNHHMVTGADNLDSYEALWELAELLGQVKPPTATKEDIDNSGLEIIKASQLSQFEAEGKVSSNCVERCLVCLDDYSSDDDLRLMSCRHAFHKDCVDKWLQVGRNNCPACRTKGVAVANDSSPQPSS